MTLDPTIAAILARARQAGLPEYWELTPQDARRQHNEKAPVLGAPYVDLFRVEDRAVPGPAGGVPVRVYTPRRPAGPAPVLVWFHGGGHVVGSLESYDTLCRQLAAQSGCLLVSVDYRLAPEHKFPAAVEDSFAALTWVAENAAAIGADPDRIAVGGDSAGGNLAAVCTILARDAGAPPLRYQLLVYPATAPYPDSPSQRELAEGYLLTRRNILWFHDHYLRGEQDREDFRWAPLLVDDLGGLPPALVIVAGYDPLRDEGIAYAERLREAGNVVELINYEGMIHAFFSMSGAVDDAREAVARAAAGLRAGLAR